ncbi:hypothetical protein MTO96_027971 [Rhipicephalus appendiculatus]
MVGDDKTAVTANLLAKANHSCQTADRVRRFRLQFWIATVNEVSHVSLAALYSAAKYPGKLYEEAARQLVFHHVVLKDSLGSGYIFHEFKLLGGKPPMETLVDAAQKHIDTILDMMKRKMEPTTSQLLGMTEGTSEDDKKFQAILLCFCLHWVLDICYEPDAKGFYSILEKLLGLDITKLSATAIHVLSALKE